MYMLCSMVDDADMGLKEDFLCSVEGFGGGIYFVTSFQTHHKSRTFSLKT